MIRFFPGLPFWGGYELDAQCERGVFNLFRHELNNKQEDVSTKIIQVRSLLTGDVLAEIADANNIDGAKFSPADSNLLLIWGRDETCLFAKLLRYSEEGAATPTEIGKILLPYPKESTANKVCRALPKFWGTFSSCGEKIVFLTEHMQVYEYDSDTMCLLKSEHLQPTRPLRSSNTCLCRKHGKGGSSAQNHRFRARFVEKIRKPIILTL